jgi:type 2 lantibiotic biosynthesis protein LanM
VTGEPSYFKVARKTINLIRKQLERARAGGAPIRSLGGFLGSGGVIYTLAHLGALWQDGSLIAEAESLARDVPSLLESDRIFDVIAGCAGCIVALAALNTVNPSGHLLDAAVLCGERILREQRPQGTGVGWDTVIATQPLTGFAHGAAGIAWALLKLASWSGDSRFLTAAEDAIAYERSTFVVAESNWPDFRKTDVGSAEGPAPPSFAVGWCHGAPGIALARVDSLAYIDDAKTREEIHIGIRKTIESGFGPNYCLCHGNAGNLEILRYTAQHMGEPWLHETASRLTDDFLAGIAQGEASGEVGALGLMAGLAGIGYSLLRIACPERVPCVLVLAPPVTAAPSFSLPA